MYSGEAEALARWRGCPEARGEPAAQAGGLQGSAAPWGLPPPPPGSQALDLPPTGPRPPGVISQQRLREHLAGRTRRAGRGSPEPGRNDLWLSFKPRRQCPLRPCGPPPPPPPPPILQLPPFPSSFGHDFPAFSALGRDRRPGGAELDAICITCPIGSCGRGGRAPPTHLPGRSAGPGRGRRATWPPPGARRPQRPRRGPPTLHAAASQSAASRKRASAGPSQSRARRPHLVLISGLHGPQASLQPTISISRLKHGFGNYE
ncbi:uncharacterized protein LOC144324394 [Canis aureus]